MKIDKYLYLIIICILIVMSGQIKAQDSIVNITAKVDKIDSTKTFYIINISFGKNKGIFFTPKTCDKYTDHIGIKKNVEYTFKFRYRSYNVQNGHLPKENTIVKYVDDKIVWTNKMRKIFYEECLNMCGLYIQK